MNGLLGDLLPLALGVAISPVPIIAAILMLLSPRARATGTGFLLGWVGGIAVAVTAFTLLAALLPSADPHAAHPIRGVIQIVLGVLLLLVALRQWRARPRPGHAPTVPKWMAAIDKTTFPVALALGFALAAVNPKNLLMAISAGTDAGTAGLDTGSLVLALAVYTLLAATTIAVPVIGYLIAADALAPRLDRLKQWLQKENAVIMAILLLVIGVSLIGKGIGSF